MNTPTQVPVKQSAAVPSRSVFNVFGSLQREIDRLFEDMTAGYIAESHVLDAKTHLDLAETKDGLARNH